MTMIPLLPKSGIFFLPPSLPGLSLPGCVFQDLFGFLPPWNQRSQSMAPLPAPYWLPTTLSSFNNSVTVPYLPIPAQTRKRGQLSTPFWLPREATELEAYPGEQTRLSLESCYPPPLTALRRGKAALRM